jgi:hypothetical protein
MRTTITNLQLLSFIMLIYLHPIKRKFRRKIRYGSESDSESELLYDWRTTSIFIFQLNTCGYSPYVTSCLTRGWVCRLQLLMAPASAVVLRSESRGSHDHILLSQIRDYPNLEGQVPVFISLRNEVARLYPSGTGLPFRRLLRLAGLHWKYSTSPPHGIGP